MSKRLIYEEDAIEWVENILEIDKYYHPHAKSRNVPIDEVIDRLKRVPTAQPEIVRCKDCRWGREACGNIECFADTNVPPEYHGYEWFCPNAERKEDEGAV